MDSLEEIDAARLLDIRLGQDILDRVNDQLLQVIAEAAAIGLILAHLPKEAKSVVIGLSLEPGAKLSGIICRELGDLLALIHDQFR